MSFIRAKEIPPKSGNWYDYEVETIHKNGRQPDAIQLRGELPKEEGSNDNDNDNGIT